MNKRSATRDHILPRTRRYTYPEGTTMHKVVCSHCNNLRAACGHCWGAVACVRAVAKLSVNGSRRPESNLAAAWRLNKIALTTEPAAPHKGPPARVRGPQTTPSRRTGFATLADVWPAKPLDA